MAKVILTTGYTFNKSAGTIAFPKPYPPKKENILSVVNYLNVPGTTIYDLDTTGLGGTYNDSTGVLTLTYNTSSMNDSDPLQIIYDDGYVSTLDEVTVELTRPADTTAYAANDAISNSTSSPTPLTLSDMGRIPGGAGLIIGAKLEVDNKLWTARTRVYLYSTSPTATNDNAAFALTYANRLIRMPTLDFGACTTEDSSSSTSAKAEIQNINQYYKCASGSKDMYALFETKDAGTPTSGMKLQLTLYILRA